MELHKGLLTVGIVLEQFLPVTNSNSHSQLCGSNSHSQLCGYNSHSQLCNSNSHSQLCNSSPECHVICFYSILFPTCYVAVLEHCTWLVLYLLLGVIASVVSELNPGKNVQMNIIVYQHLIYCISHFSSYCKKRGGNQEVSLRLKKMVLKSMCKNYFIGYLIANGHI